MWGWVRGALQKKKPGPLWAAPTNLLPSEYTATHVLWIGANRADGDSPFKPFKQHRETKSRPRKHWITMTCADSFHRLRTECNPTGLSWPTHVYDASVKRLKMHSKSN